MRPGTRKRTNVAIGIGIVMQLAGVILYRMIPHGAHTTIGASMIVASLVFIIWGCMSYAEGKGHSRSAGLVGVLGVVGLIVLVLLPDRSAGVQRVGFRKVAAVIALIVSFVVLSLGLWMHAIGENVRVEQMLGWWPAIAMLTGFCLAVGALPFLLGRDASAQRHITDDAPASNSVSPSAPPPPDSL